MSGELIEQLFLPTILPFLALYGTKYIDIAHSYPVVSAADVLYLAAYPVLALGLLSTTASESQSLGP